ncbi:lantibiotic dehydratase [Micromonospora sp. Llam0]|uniref:lantibiotic dehydratase n=1 Tax=Micromonospora sp. Llam0 TaxID=2485143 RepID=UPI001F4881EA|nr:lantibiotic dehydratase [Micromonospora sp. Llam0]
MVRAAVCPPDQLRQGWPDLTGPEGVASWRPWLRQVFAVPQFAAAVEHASPVLAERARVICDGHATSERQARRVVMSVLRYLLRARGRATPFGLFAGVAVTRLASTTTVRLGTEHRAIARAGARWLAEVIDELEADPILTRHLLVRANDLLTFRDGEVVLEHRFRQRPDENRAEVHVRGTGPVRAALAAASDPVLFADLVDKLATDHRVGAGVVSALLAEMVSQRLLLTELRPASTSIDPLSVVVAGVDRALASRDDRYPSDEKFTDEPSAGTRIQRLSDQIARHRRAPVSATAERRARLTEAMAALHPTGEPSVVVDVRLDIELAITETVASEAASAADALTRLSGSGRTGWPAWHRLFLERYGPHALVPVRDVVDADIGLGFPAGYRGAPPTPAAVLTPRDRKLLALTQNAALRRQHEIVLDDTAIGDLADGVPRIRIRPSTELTVTVQARTVQDLDQGTFQLVVVGVSRNAGTTTGRFLDLLDTTDQKRIADQYSYLSTTTRGALPAQVSAVTPYTITEDVARAPQVMPYVIPVGEYHDSGSDRITLDDIAVTADANRVYLVSVSRRRLLEPIVLNAVEQVHYTLPIVRFLTEATTAFSTACTAFDWGAASGLPFLPALRYGRTILSPARWLLARTALTTATTSWREWTEKLWSWQTTTGCPQTVYLGDSDQRIGLDLAEPAHQALLRDHLDRNTTAVLRAAPLPDTAGWIGGHAHEIVIPLASTANPAPPPPLIATAPVVNVREHGHLPGSDERLYLKLYGHPGRQTTILTQHLPLLLHRLGTPARWWFLRYGDPEPHLRLRLTGDPDHTLIGQWTCELRRAGLIARVQIDTDYPEDARFGGPATREASNEVFAADSATAVAQLALVRHERTPDIRAATAANLLDLTTSVLGEDTGMRWLIDHTRPYRPAPPRDVYQHTIQLTGPDQPQMTGSQDREKLHAARRWRHQALARYRDTLTAATIAPASVLPDLLHLHHTRMIGPDPNSERLCLHLARAAALSWTTRAPSRR